MSATNINNLNFNLLLDEIESGSSGSLANVIRKLRESELAAFKARIGGPTGELLASFIASLDLRASEHNAEIEKTCSYHYQSFVDSTRELLEIQQNAEKLENDLQALNVELEVTVNKFSESCDKLAACKLTLDHVNQCIEAIQISLPILEQYSRIEQSIADGRYYHALKNLEDLEHSQLDLIRPFAFSEIIIHRIPKTRTRIKNASLDELTDFLEYIRKNSIVLGAFAMREAAQVSGIDSEALCDTLAVNGYKEAQDVSKKPNNESQQQVMLKSLVHKASVNTNTDSLDNELEMLTQIVTNKNHPWITNDDHGEPEMTIKTQINVNNDDNCCNRTYSKVEDLVDFGPVYRCLHIHSVLNERAEFERHYCTQRRKQCQLILSLSPNQQVEMRNYGEFFSGICGFFVVDDFIRHTLSGSSVFYQTYLDELWVHTVNRLIDFVHVNAKSCDSPNDLIKLKDYLIIFERTMQNLGFPITGLTETIGIVQRYYHRLLASQWKFKFEAIIAEDSYETIKISNSEQLAEFLEMYPPGDTVEFSELPFPKQLCFSWMVPKIYQTVREYINLCYRFCENMDLAYTELEDTINRATNFLFSQCLNTVLTSGVRSSLRQLPRLTQFCINLDELETVCGHLDNYLQYTLLDEASSITSGRLKDFAMIRDNQREDPDMTTSVTLNSGANPPRSRLQGASLLKDIRVLVEDQICNHLKDNVAKFINLSNYDDTDDNNSGQTNNNTNKNDQLLNNSQTVDGRNGVSYITNTKIKPTENIVHLTSWLKSVFDSFSNLPPKIAQTACISVCKHIARLLYDVLFGSQVRSLSETGLQQLSIDLSLCESFARSQPVPGLDRTTLWLIFADLRQLLDLYHKDDWTSYIAFRKNVTGSAYDRVPPSVAIKLLERLRDSDKKRTGFLQAMRKEERGRKKKLEDIIRQLRELNVTPRNN
ncbi:Exocyst complex component 6B [Schistosoma haematobium]|uniref:Exocyst complex component n=2 Tax=Schistosoma haematobium TaxID=6185 RepID=A0A922IRK7_SCHHA|nr:Exocyst complex component 6B [Schistosoma haematobium]KAH9584699.1 Exocyst complex component 6B [Schistosoma haematobium]